MASFTMERAGLEGSTLTDAQMAELKATADALCAPGKGFLASDESAGPWLRAGHSEAKKIPDTAENRAAYRSMLYTTPGLSENISGVILHKETLYQCDANGTKMVDLITGNGMIPGIKVDSGYDKKGMPNTPVGPSAARRPTRASTGSRPWPPPPTRRAPTSLSGATCCRSTRAEPPRARRHRVVALPHATRPSAGATASYIVEPEIVPNGDHSIEACAKATERVLQSQFAALALHKVYLEGCLLKPNMVKGGLKGPRATAEEIAVLTITALKRTVPSALPGIFFLSGEMPLDTDNEEDATINLSKMHEMYPSLPWHVSFSYGKALQKTCIVTWLGLEANKAAAQKALKARSAANTDAVFGKYKAGTCASVGLDGNIAQAAGPY